MKRAATLALLSACLLPACAAEERAPEAQKKAGPVNWLWRHIPVPKFGGGKEKDGATWNDLALKLRLDPAAPRLPETRRLEVSLELSNAGRKLVQLEFPTSQRIEVLVRNEAGKVLERWSEDQPVSPEPNVVTLNPGERLEYHAALSTREMSAGQRYTIEAFFPRYEKLRASRVIVPAR
jgi:hypothetical protein